MKASELAVLLLCGASVLGGGPTWAGEPCTHNSCTAKYTNFIRKHIVEDIFDRNSVDAWESYLMKKQLWCRVTMQSFMESLQQVEDICSGGLRLDNNKNLCMSRTDMLVYDITTTQDQNGCRISVAPSTKPVIVACDNVPTDNAGDRCVPVHFEAYRNQQPTSVPCRG